MTADAAVQQETATVWTTPQGAPARLLWAGRRFTVIAKPIAWMDRISWWESSLRVPAGSAAAVVERPMWQVQARAVEDGEILIFDLAASDGAQWPITAIYD
ncbi:DUF6504 family protein [Nesterenkonia sp.]|uniref:DUF6504 family protein n=1 Tax=Nesterenkonia sp. TaxID=704201 RepID=UPI00260860FC|nr:DUF6504 family protein [Nesterenkonia sp.]